MPERLEDEDEAIVVNVLDRDKEWQVDFQATYWIARSRRPLTLKIGDTVRVIGRQNNTLFIETIPH
jgi:membrane protein implicated in regulation of membrane protease activity